MLRVRDILPQAASGSLADVVGSCAGSHRPASGCLLSFCCWRVGWPALSSWILFPLTALGFVKLYSIQICHLWMNSLRAKMELFFTVVFNDQLDCQVRYSGKPNRTRAFLSLELSYFFVLPSTQCVSTQLLGCRPSDFVWILRFVISVVIGVSFKAFLASLYSFSRSIFYTFSLIKTERKETCDFDNWLRSNVMK